MIHFSHDVVIHRPIEMVFGFVTDLRNLPLWLKAVDDAEKPSTDEFLLKIRLWKPLHTWHMLQPTEHQLHTFARFEHHDSAVNYELPLWFTRLDDERTKFTFKGKIYPRGILTPVISLIVRHLERQLIAALPLLKTELEKSPHQN